MELLLDYGDFRAISSNFWLAASPPRDFPTNPNNPQHHCHNRLRCMRHCDLTPPSATRLGNAINVAILQRCREKNKRRCFSRPSWTGGISPLSTLRAESQCSLHSMKLHPTSSSLAAAIQPSAPKRRYGPNNVFLCKGGSSIRIVIRRESFLLKYGRLHQ